jgi:hypothetical protein
VRRWVARFGPHYSAHGASPGAGGVYMSGLVYDGARVVRSDRCSIAPA